VLYPRKNDLCCFGCVTSSLLLISFLHLMTKSMKITFKSANKWVFCILHMIMLSRLWCRWSGHRRLCTGCHGSHCKTHVAWYWTVDQCLVLHDSRVVSLEEEVMLLLGSTVESTWLANLVHSSWKLSQVHKTNSSSQD